MGGAGRRRVRRAASRVKAHGSELEYSMRGQRRARGLGRGSRCAARRRSSSARITSGGCSRTSSATSTASTRSRPGSTSTSSSRGRADEALAALLEECRADPPNPGNRQERLPDEGNDRRLAEFLAGDAPTVLYFGKLLYNKGVHVLLEALRGIDARTRRRRLRRLPARAGAARAAAHALHRAARAPPPRPPDPARRRRRRPVDLPGGVRDGRRRGGGRRVPAARRAALGPRGGRARRSRRRTRRSCARWRASRPATRSTSPTSSTSCSRSRPRRARGARRGRPAGRGREVVVGGRRGASASNPSNRLLHFNG